MIVLGRKTAGKERLSPHEKPAQQEERNGEGWKDEKQNGRREKVRLTSSTQGGCSLRRPLDKA